MLSRSFLIVTAVLVALLVGAGALYAFDASRADQIANGVRIAGVDVGGLDRAQASARIERRLLAPLDRPVVVDHGRSAWRLSAREARLAVDVRGMVDEAVARSREGALPARRLRALTGRRLDVDVTARVRFSRPAVVRLLDRVRRGIERKPRDARVAFSPDGLRRVLGQDGLAVRASELHRAIRGAIVSPTAERRFVARTRHVAPKVSDQDLERRYDTVLIVDRGSFKLKLYKGLALVKTFGIAVGKVGLETPAGLYNIQNKAENPAWHVPDSEWAGKLAGKVIAGDDPTNPIKARWMGIYDGAGIHGTDAADSIGSAASHGCIRMRIPDVVELYDDVPVGASVYIA